MAGVEAGAGGQGPGELSGGRHQSIAAAIVEAARALAATSDTARLDAELLMAHALGTTREAVLLGDPGADAPAEYAALVARRLSHEPVAYITGRKGFWTIELAVSPDVLIPRPDSEILIEAAIAHFVGRAPERVLDLGTGSGALLLAALAQWPEATGTGVDLSPAALVVARANAERLGMAGRVRFEEGGWRRDTQADLVLCNPPYVETVADLPAGVIDHEPHMALFAGADGVDEYRRIAPVMAFAPGGCACIEIGAGQGESAGALFRAEGFAVEVLPDLAGRDRCLRLTA